MDNYESRTDVTSGVPQGSVPGIILLHLFVNYLTHELANTCFIFADNAKLAGFRGGGKIVNWLVYTTKFDKCQPLTAKGDQVRDELLCCMPGVKDLRYHVTHDFQLSRFCQVAANWALGVLTRVCTAVLCAHAMRQCIPHFGIFNFFNRILLHVYEFCRGVPGPSNENGSNEGGVMYKEFKI